MHTDVPGASSLGLWVQGAPVTQGWVWVLPRAGKGLSQPGWTQLWASEHPWGTRAWAVLAGVPPRAPAGCQGQADTAATGLWRLLGRFLSPPVPKGAWISGSGTIGVCDSDGLVCAGHSSFLPSLVCCVPPVAFPSFSGSFAGGSLAESNQCPCQTLGGKAVFL